MNKEEALKGIDAFEKRYNYNSDFIRDMLHHSDGGFAVYSGFHPMAVYRDAMPVEEYYVAKIATMQTEDCGECLQLNVDFARESGVSPELIRSALAGGSGLPSDLKAVYDYAVSVAAHSEIPEESVKELEHRYGMTFMVELALCIASAKVFPTIKRTLGYAKSCRLVTVEVG